MTNLEKLYQSIANLKELGLPLHEETLKAVDNLEEELIKNEIIPRLSESIEAIITQIQRPIVLVVDYIPNESLSVRLTRKRVITDETETKQYSLAPKSKDKEKKTDKTITSAPKSSKTGLAVTFPDGTVISNRYAYETLIDVVKRVGITKVENLQLKHLGLNLVSKIKDDFYNQHELSGGYLIVSHSATVKKKQQLDEISERLKLGLKVEIA
ncbi:MAG: hypothetical protein Q7U47_10545 [Paludibacter sp.]|nr:hypothetical protein [Paludibacter sp.]